MKRRHFLQSTAAASLLSSPVFALSPDNAYRKAIGIQLYTLRDQIKADTSGTIKTVVEAGYKQGELYGFPDCQPMIDAAKEHGLQLHSAHFAWESVTNPDKEGVPAFEGIVGKAKELGLSHLVIPYLFDHERKNLDDYKRLAERCNKAAQVSKAAGIQLAYHNHAFEFGPMDDKGGNGFQILMDEFAPEMKFEVDVFWVKVGGHDPVKMLQKLDGRVSQLHLKDLKKDMKLPNFGGVPKDAFEELGDGSIDMEPIMVAGEKIGVDICHVEQDQSPNPIASIKQSMAYLKSL